MNLKKGTSLQNGRYRIESVLGQGGFGITYLAVQTDLDCKVAIKEFFMKDFCNRDADTYQVSVPSVGSKELVEKFKSKFIREAKSIASFHHQGIVRVSAVFEENGTAYYVMDYLEGGSLSDLVGRTGLPERQALFYIRQISEALGYVHARNMLHLDLKPGNIMLDDDGRAVLIDFGVSKQYDEVSGENTSTLLGYTPGYAPPEQMDRDVKAFFPATDIYSLGAILYNLITGIAPLSATRRISGEELDPLPSGVSPSVRRAIDEAMQFNKSKRPQTVADFLALLDAPVSAVSEETIHDADEPTVHDDEPEKKNKANNGGSASNVADGKPVVDESEKKKGKSLMLWVLIALIGIGVGLSALFMGGETGDSSPVVSDSDSVRVTTPAVATPAPQIEEDIPAQANKANKVNKVNEDSLRLVADEQQAESLRIAEERRLAEDAELARQEEQRRAEEEERKRQAEQRQAEERRQAEEAERKRQEEEARRQAASVTTDSRGNKTFTANGVSFKMVAVKGGTFRMGATKEMDSDAESDESPVHDVTLSDYYIGETEVTQELWQAVMGSNPSYFTGNLQRPVETVCWSDCQAFVRKLNELTGGSFRLPTEAEWEYAARGGQKSRGYEYSGSNNIGEVAWYTSNSSGTTHAVKTKSPNELGIYDMSGNVNEWCQDWYGDYSNAAQTNPKGPSSGSYRVDRGGGWFGNATYCRCTNRIRSTPSYTYDGLGLRLVSQ